MHATPHRQRIAAGCYAATALSYAAFGAMYLFRPEFMPYHAVAVGMKWGEVPPPFQVLTLALMRVAGGTWLALALALGVLVFIPFRQGARWAHRMIPLIGLTASGAALYATWFVQTHSPAHPPVLLAAAGVAATLAGWVLAPGFSSNKLD